MLKSYLGYIVIAALLHGGQFALTFLYPDYFLMNQIFLVQTYLVLVFLISEILVHFLSTLLKVYLGQLFLLTSTFKIVGTGFYVMVLKRLWEIELPKQVILTLMFSYSIYLFFSVNRIVKKIAEDKD